MSINNMLSDSIIGVQPNIVKAQFIVTESRIYTLEFDQNIQMKELKIMIQVAAHLKKKISAYFMKVKNIPNIMMNHLNHFFQMKN